MRAVTKDSGSARRPLRAQSGDFWLGAFMVAEAPLLFVLAFLDPATRESLWASVVASPLGIAGAAGVVLALGLSAGWVGHRLGFGQ